MKPVNLDALFDVLALPQTRDEALERGLNRYFTGEPCKKGHVAARIAKGNCCAECAKLRVQKWRDANPAQMAEIARDWARANPEKVKANRQRCRASNLEKVKERERKHSADHRRANLEKERERLRQYWRDNPEKMRANTARRRARWLGAEGFHTPQDLKAIRLAQLGCCAACGASLRGRGHIDHIKPLSQGGTNWPSNIQYLCRNCNLRKSAKDYNVFLAENGLVPWHVKT